MYVKLNSTVSSVCLLFGQKVSSLFIIRTGSVYMTFLDWWSVREIEFYCEFCLSPIHSKVSSLFFIIWISSVYMMFHVRQTDVTDVAWTWHCILQSCRLSCISFKGYYWQRLTREIGQLATYFLRKGACHEHAKRMNRVQCKWKLEYFTQAMIRCGKTYDA